MAEIGSNVKYNARADAEVLMRKAGVGGLPNLADLGKPGIIGVGDQRKANAGLAGCCEMISKMTACPSFHTPSFDEVRWTLNGPQTDASIAANFTDRVDLFGNPRSVPGIDYVETTFQTPGISQTPFLAMGLFFHMEIEPTIWTAKGNGVTKLSPAVQKPISPDSWTGQDLLALPQGGGAGTNTLGLSTGATMVPAVLESGWWSELAAWFMSRAFNLRWQYGRHTLLIDDILRNRAYMTPSGQTGASSSEIDINYAAARANARYDVLGGTFNFLPIDAVRLGSSNKLGTGAALGSLFRPSRAYETVGVTYGGIGLRDSFSKNPEIAMLKVPTLVKQGVPYGLYCAEVDPVQGNLFRAYLSASSSLAGTFSAPGNLTPLVGPDGNSFPTTNTNTGVPGTGASVAVTTAATSQAAEYTLDGTQALVANSWPSARMVFKFGEVKFTLGVLGFEIPESIMDAMCSDPDTRAVVEETCKCQFAST